MKLHNRSGRILLAVIIGIVFACGAFLLQHTTEHLSLTKINPDKITIKASNAIETVYNGINQVKITGYSAIQGVSSKSTTISVFAVPQGGDIYSGYILPSSQYSDSAAIKVYGHTYDYSMAGVAANCYVDQIPHGNYLIGIMNKTADGGLAYSLTQSVFQNGLYESQLEILFFLFTFIVYAISSFICLELLFRKKTSTLADTPAGNSPQKHSFLSIINIIILAIFFWIFLNVTFANTDTYANIEIFKSLFTVWSAILLIIVMYCLWSGIDFTKKLTAKQKIFIAAGCAGFFLFQLAVCNSLNGQIRGFDSTYIANSAYTYLQYGKVTYNPQYFVVYPNNYFMLFTDIWLYKLAAGSQALFTQLSFLVNIICLDIAILLSYLSIRQLLGRKIAVVMLIPLCLIIGLNPMMNMFYTDILSMVFTALVFFLYLKLRKTKRIWVKAVLLVLIALAAYVGYQYKMTSIIILVAIALVELITHIKEWKRLLSVILSCVLVFGIVFTLNSETKDFTDSASMLQIKMKDNPDLEAFPFWHWMMVGLHYPYGELATSDWDFSITRPKATREGQIKGVIMERLIEYGPAGYISFLNSKAVHAFGDSTFSAGNGTYGNEYLMPDNLFSMLLQDVFGSSGKWFPYFAYILQGAWVLCLFLIVCPLFFKNKKKTDKTVSILRLSLTGILAYLLLSENNTRQLVNQLPLIIILAAFSVDPVMGGLKNFAQKALLKQKK